jgi:cell division protein FtsI/penicillin-binding protein 2
VTTTRTRIGVIAAVFASAFVVVVLNLWLLMVSDHEAWAARSDDNRWAFRSVPGRRGALLDRFGRELARDEPTTELAVHYVRFRIRHPVGAAVHGATTWARQQANRAGTTYDYGDGALGPATAVRELLAMPARTLAPRVLPKDVASVLATSVTTVLAGCSGLPRSRVFASLRHAARSGEGAAVGDALVPLGLDRQALLVAFEQRLAALHRLEARCSTAARERPSHGPAADDIPGLFATLEHLRRASLAKERVTWEEDGETKEGSLIEAVRRPFASDVPYEIAAELALAAELYAGIEVLPAAKRVRTVAPGTALQALLGGVAAIDKALPSREWLADLAEREMPDEWLADLAPPDVDGGDAAALRASMRERYSRELLQRERRGTSGIERAFDGELMGRLGLRFVEVDSRRREQVLWSHLRVAAGEAVQLTIDLDLQRLAEAAAVAARTRNLHGDESTHDRIQAAIAIVDAATGDLLAYAGAPNASGSAAGIPGVVWSGNGALGSVVKPFVLVEQLQSESMGRPHAPLASLAACSGSFRYGGQTMGCGQAHYDAGRDPIEALAASCNLFFYQCALGLGDDGVARSLRRFGLAPTPADDPFTACWQPGIRGLPASRPRRDSEHTPLPKRAVGYGVEASPVDVARAYAALATGWLPTVALVPGPRSRVPLDDVAGELELVRRGLRACVEHGTAKRLSLLAELGMHGKTGTAEVGSRDENNAWFAGWLPPGGDAGVQLCCCAVVYWVEDGVHGGDAAGQLVVDVLQSLRADPVLQARYLAPEGGR